MWKCANTVCEHLLNTGAIHAVVAGSMRRGKETPKDIEIVVCPEYDTDLFGDTLPTSSKLLTGIDNARKTLGWIDTDLHLDDEVKRDGNKHKRYVLRRPCDGAPVDRCILDLFITVPENHGLILIIRTGCGDFSKEIMTSPALGGRVLPPGYRVEGGFLWRFIGSGHWRSAGTGDWQKVPVPDEEAFFGICGLPVPRPEERNAMWFSQMTARPRGSREVVGV
jgi:hypothetical protein